MSKAEIAAKMAGEWWAARLSEKYADRMDAISAAVTKKVSEELNGVSSWDWWGARSDGDGKPRKSSKVECDYEPNGLLAAAVAEVFHDIDRFRLFTSVQDLFPQKHLLIVTRDELRPKEGYGNWQENIPVPG